jgi:anti-anti-sigma regulatory factor
MSVSNERGALRLPPELTIYHVSELAPQWLSWADAAAAAAQPPVVEADGVDEVDCAGLQLLLSLQHTLAARGVPWQLQQPSAALQQGCEALGVWDAVAPGATA